MFKNLCGLLGLFFCFSVYAAPVRIVAAENFYGQVAEHIGGPYVQVTSILENPQQDPHLFSSSPKTAKAIAKAQIIVYNGLGYDPWMKNLIEAAHPQIVINLGELMSKSLGDNPHIWYNPQTMLTYAHYLTKQLVRLDSAHQDFYQQQLADFKKNYQNLFDKIDSLRSQYQGLPVAATEPVFNDMADALGLIMKGQDFQLSIMNDTEPSISEIKNFEDLLNNHEVKVLIYNNQVNNPSTERVQNLAKKQEIPIVGVTETLPAGQTYLSWMLNQLETLNIALKKNK